MNSLVLKGKIRENGLSQERVAKEIGVSLSRFSAKINETGGAVFTVDEAKALKRLLNLDIELVNRIFFED